MPNKDAGANPDERRSRALCNRTSLAAFIRIAELGSLIWLYRSQEGVDLPKVFFLVWVEAKG